MKTTKRVWAVLCALVLLFSASVALADDGFSTSYTYTYDYWEEVQESPDAYRVATVIDSMSLGLDRLENKRISKPQSLFVLGQSLYVCDTGNNRILELNRRNNNFSVKQIFNTVYGTAEDYAMAEKINVQRTAYEDAIQLQTTLEKEIADLEEQLVKAEQSSLSDVSEDETVDYEAFEKEKNEKIEGIQASITDLNLQLEEAKERIPQKYQELLTATEEAKDAGCRIWYYPAWSLNEEGKAVSTLNTPNDISVDEDGNYYIADTNNYRILKMDKDFNLIWEFTKPTDATFDQNLNFLPKKIVVDVAGRVYALCQNVNKGLVKYEADGTFSGFIGANTVTVSMAEYIWKRYFQTKEQRAQTENFVPTEYENVYIDREGFIYATNIVFSEYDLKYDNAKPIRRLNSLGSDILIKNDKYPPIGDLDWVEQGSESSGPSKFVDITVLDNDIYVALDRTRGRLFGYDSQGVLLWAFGTKGNIEGAFTGAVSIEHMDYDLLVLDQLENSITVFQTTEYGQTIYDASEKYLAGEYDESADLWRDVIRMNANYPLAFRGIGRAVLRQNQYEEAMDYFELAHDRENYGRAFKLYRKEWVERNVWWIITILAAIIIIPLAIGKAKKTKWEVIEHERSKVRK